MNEPEEWLREFANALDKAARLADEAHFYINDEEDLKAFSNMAAYFRQQAEECRPPKYTDNVILFPLGR